MRSIEPTETQILILERLSKYERPVLANSMGIDMPALKIGKELSNLEKRGLVHSEDYLKSNIWSITQQGRDYLEPKQSYDNRSYRDIVDDTVLTSTNPIFFIVSDAQLAHIVNQKLGELIPQDKLKLQDTISELNTIVIDYKRMYTEVVHQRDDLQKKIERLERKISLMSKMIQED